MNDRSRKNLETCHEDLQRLFNAVDSIFPIVITEGYRNKVMQKYLYNIGRSKVRRSKHNIEPSEALDVYPTPINWQNTKRMYYLGGLIRGIAISMEIKIRWGGDWDGDTEILDQSFNDLGHFELVDN